MQKPSMTIQKLGAAAQMNIPAAANPVPASTTLRGMNRVQLQLLTSPRQKYKSSVAEKTDATRYGATPKLSAMPANERERLNKPPDTIVFTRKAPARTRLRSARHRSHLGGRGGADA